MTTREAFQAQLARLSALGEGQRRALYALVAGQRRPISRDEAAAAVGISRPLAAYHLDRLVEDGLLEARFERRTGRRGPGAGRPAKLYQRSAEPVELSIPARDYAFLAELLADAVERDSTGAARRALEEVAADAGARSTTGASRESVDPAESYGQLQRILAERGYEPYEDDGELRLRNCPFHRLAEDHRDLVCRANHAFICGMAGQTLSPRLEPRAGECCVAIARPPSVPAVPWRPDPARTPSRPGPPSS